MAGVGRGVGYAPDRWTALTDHLRRGGASDEEILAAGLGTTASTGRVIDRFRGRLVFPIKGTNADGDPEVHGWIGRRNTADTKLFHKGTELYGLTEAAPALADGAAIVIVEGPLDAIHRYRRSYLLHLSTNFGEMAFMDIESDDIEDWMVEQRDLPSSGKSVRNRHGLLFPILAYGQKRLRLRPDNPAELTRLPSKDAEVGRQVRFFQHGEWALFRSCLKSDVHLMVDVALAPVLTRTGPAIRSACACDPRQTGI